MVSTDRKRRTRLRNRHANLWLPFLQHGDVEQFDDTLTQFNLFGHDLDGMPVAIADDVRQQWDLQRGAILGQWPADSRPHAWWLCDSAEPRQLTVAAPFTIRPEFGWRAFHGCSRFSPFAEPSGIMSINIRPEYERYFESQANYLLRLTNQPQQ